MHMASPVFPHPPPAPPLSRSLALSLSLFLHSDVESTFKAREFARRQIGNLLHESVPIFKDEVLLPTHTAAYTLLLTGCHLHAATYTQLPTRGYLHAASMPVFWLVRLCARLVTARTGSVA